MKRKVSSIILIVLVVTVLCMPSAFAVVDSNPCIEYVEGIALAEGGQVIRFEVGVYGSDYMTEIGASRMEVYKSDGTYVRTYYATNPMYEDYLMSTNATHHEGYIRFRGDVGVSYYSVIYYTATNADGVTGTETFRSNTVTCLA